MSIKSLLEEAKVAKQNADREELKLLAKKKRDAELRDLDLTPEEYMLLRDDDQELGVDLLQAILEITNQSSWRVDNNTRRLCRIDEVQSGYKQSNRLAITSNSRQFFLRFFGDKETVLPDTIFATCTSIVEAISLVDCAFEELRKGEIIRFAESAFKRLRAYEDSIASLEDSLSKFQSEYNQRVDGFNKRIAMLVEKFENKSMFCTTERKTIAVNFSVPQQTATKYLGEGRYLALLDGVCCQLENLQQVHLENSICMVCDVSVSLADLKFMLPIPVSKEYIRPITFSIATDVNDQFSVESIEEKLNRAKQIQEEDVKKTKDFFDQALVHLSIFETNFEEHPLSQLLMELGGDQQEERYLVQTRGKDLESVTNLVAKLSKQLGPDDSNSLIHELVDMAFIESEKFDVFLDDFDAAIEKWIERQAESIKLLMWKASQVQ